VLLKRKPGMRKFSTYLAIAFFINVPFSTHAFTQGQAANINQLKSDIEKGQLTATQAHDRALIVTKGIPRTARIVENLIEVAEKKFDVPNILEYIAPQEKSDNIVPSASIPQLGAQFRELEARPTAGFMTQADIQTIIDTAQDIARDLRDLGQDATKVEEFIQTMVELSQHLENVIQRRREKQVS
jgi:hypothetical protein